MFSPELMLVMPRSSSDVLIWSSGAPQPPPGLNGPYQKPAIPKESRQYFAFLLERTPPPWLLRSRRDVATPRLPQNKGVSSWNREKLEAAESESRPHKEAQGKDTREQIQQEIQDGREAPSTAILSPRNTVGPLTGGTQGLYPHNKELEKMLQKNRKYLGPGGYMLGDPAPPR